MPSPAGQPVKRRRRRGAVLASELKGCWLRLKSKKGVGEGGFLQQLRYQTACVYFSLD